MSADRDDAARLLAEIHAARGLMRRPVDAARPADAVRPADGARPADAVRPGTGALWAHAVRAPGAPVDLAVVRALRADPATAARYRTLVAAQAVAHAPFAAAASDGALRSRRVGSFVLDLVPAEDDAPPLLVIRGGDGRTLTAIEAMLGPEALRLALPPAAEGAMVLALDPAVPEADGLGRLLADPAAAVFLL